VADPSLAADGAAGAQNTWTGTRTRRRGPSFLQVLLIALLLVLILSVVGTILLWQRVTAFNESVSSAPMTSAALFGPLNGEERVNVVLYGYGGPDHKGGKYLADSIQIMSIDPKTDTTTIIPIPRDFWIEGLAQLPDNGKINEAFAAGYQAGGVANGAAFSTELLAEVTGLQIDHWIAIDMTGFQAMIDAVGGVTINNPRAFGYTWSPHAFERQNWNAGEFAKGTLHLDGKAALDYSRARYTSVPRESSDFARSIRQQRVMAALRAQVGGGLGSLGTGLSLMDALKGRMQTNLSAIDLFLLSGHIGADRRLELKEGVILEATGNTAGQYILVVIGRSSSTDYAPLHAFLERELAKPIRTPAPSPSAAP
jgi:LCP family protein required for cell wall assembly